MSIEAMKQMVDALMVAVEYVEEGAEEFRRKFAGYKEQRHKAMDDDVKQVNDAIAAGKAAIETAEKQEPVAYSVGRTLHWHEGRGVSDAQLYTTPPAAQRQCEDDK